MVGRKPGKVSRHCQNLHLTDRPASDGSHINAMNVTIGFTTCWLLADTDRRCGTTQPEATKIFGHGRKSLRSSRPAIWIALGKSHFSSNVTLQMPLPDRST